MARSHGKDARFYVNGTDLSAYTSQVSPRRAAATHDATTFGSNGNLEFDPGLRSMELDFDTFHDAGAGAEDAVLTALVGVDTAVVSLLTEDGDAIGDTGMLLGAATLERYELAANVADLLKKTGTFRGSGSHGRSIVLHMLGQETITGSSSSHDGAASSANGARANLHITAITGTWTIKVQHSANDSTWADLITFSGKTATGGSTGTASGTVNRYLRANFTEDSAGSITFALGTARL